jgi:uncharacterized protein YbaA (DUF1428 family)
MDKEEILFNKIANSLSKDSNVTKGKMMSAPRIKYKSKFFVFYYNKDMIFRLGSNFDPARHNVKK